MLSQQDLDRLALSADDVPGYTVQASTEKAAPVDHDVLTTYRAVSPAACQPIHAAADFGSLHDFSAQVRSASVLSSSSPGRRGGQLPSREACGPSSGARRVRRLMASTS